MDKFSDCLWRSTFEVVYGWIYKADVVGRENFPKEGPVIVAPNHKSNNDPCIVGRALPRHVSFMAKEELFKNPISNFFCRWLGAFPLKRGGVDKIAIRHAMGLLKNNLVLGIFPEGTRQKKDNTLGRFHDGVASMALRTGVPVVPVAIMGSYQMKRGQVAAVIGKPIPVAKAKPTPEAIAELNDKVRVALEGLMADYRAAHPDFKR